MSDPAAAGQPNQKTRSPEGCDENGPAAALLLSHVSIKICSFVVPCRRPILIATPLPRSLTWCTSARFSSSAAYECASCVSVNAVALIFLFFSPYCRIPAHRGATTSTVRLKTDASEPSEHPNRGRVESRRRYALARPCPVSCHALR
jgi:hypothetical protein